MAYAIRDGILLGITLATLFGFGPALLALVQTSIHRGFKAGISLAVGVFLSDLFLVLLSFEGVIQIVEQPKNKMAFGLVGGVILIVFGIITALRKARTEVDEIEVHNPRTITYILKGFFLNVALYLDFLDGHHDCHYEQLRSGRRSHFNHVCHHLNHGFHERCA